jgi:hypothetical protein
VSLGSDEAAVLRGLVGEMKTLLEGDNREDEVTRRLFPDAYDEPSDALKFRELVHDDLKASKAEALDVVQKVLGSHGKVDASLAPGEVEAWLTVLTDMRLAIGTRVGVDEEKMSAELDPGDPEAGALAALHWLGWLQESLLAKLNP